MVRFETEGGTSIPINHDLFLALFPQISEGGQVPRSSEIQLSLHFENSVTAGPSSLAPGQANRDGRILLPSQTSEMRDEDRNERASKQKKKMTIRTRSRQSPPMKSRPITSTHLRVLSARKEELPETSASTSAAEFHVQGGYLTPKDDEEDEAKGWKRNYTWNEPFSHEMVRVNHTLIMDVPNIPHPDDAKEKRKRYSGGSRDDEKGEGGDVSKGTLSISEKVKAFATRSLQNMGIGKRMKAEEYEKCLAELEKGGKGKGKGKEDPKSPSSQHGRSVSAPETVDKGTEIILAKDGVKLPTIPQEKEKEKEKRGNE